MVCRNRCAVIRRLAGGVDQPGRGARFGERHIEQQRLRQQFAADHEDVLDLASCTGVEALPGSLLPGALDQRLQHLGRLRMQRNHALGVSLTDGDPQPRVPVRIGVEAINREAADLVAPGAAPPRHDQRGPLERIRQLVDSTHERRELVVGDEPRQPSGDLRGCLRG